jgi:hypothetical protein
MDATTGEVTAVKRKRHEIFIVGRSHHHPERHGPFGSHDTTSHNTRVFDLTYFSRSQRSNVNWGHSFPNHISVTIDARRFIFWWYDGHIVPCAF